MEWRWSSLLVECARGVAARGGRLFVVGGAVRDQLLRVAVGDEDAEVYGLLGDAVMETLKQVGEVKEIGRGFPVWQVRKGEKTVEIALPRSESASGPGHRDVRVIGDPFLSRERAVRRRDFTVNALLVDPLTSELLDLVGGVEDCERRLLRVVDDERFPEDPLRILRACQLTARFALVPTAETRTLLAHMVAQGALGHLMPERVGEEWKKLLFSPKPSLGLRLLEEIGGLAAYPELASLPSTPQEPEWHPEGDVWTHTLMVTDEAAKKDASLRVRLAAFCHDFGKADVTRVIDGRIRAMGHEEAGVPLAHGFLSGLQMNRGDIRAIGAMVGDHLKPSTYWRKYDRGELSPAQYENALRQVMKRLTLAGVSLDEYLLVTECDVRGRGFPDAATKAYLPGQQWREVLAVAPWRDDPTAPLLSGKELVRLGVDPGPEMGEWIKKIEQARDEGAVRTKEEARLWIAEQQRQ